MLVIAAATRSTADAAEAALHVEGAAAVDRRAVGPDRILVTGGPFDDGKAVSVVARMRGMGWPASDRPEGGGHLAAWRRHTAPCLVGDRLWVCYPWSEADRPASGQRGAPAVLEIDPDVAFGTGGHPSTVLLLAELATRIGGGERVLDVGCGSGVLAVAAALLGASAVVAIDITTAAVTATGANARRNGVSGRIRASCTPVEDVRGLFDVVLANIGAGTLRSIGAALVRRLAPGGWAGLSGISSAQVSTVAAALPGLTVVGSPTLDDWCAIVAG